MLRFGIRTIFAVTTLAALLTLWLIPFEADVGFSQPVLAPSELAKPASDYVKLETTVTNHSLGSIWIRVYNDQLASYTCKEADGAEDYSMNMPSVETHKRIRGGESAKLEFYAGAGWNQYQIDFDVFDWRGRTCKITSEAVTHK